MSVADASVAALLLTNRIVDVGTQPLAAGEFWALRLAVDDLSLLMGLPAADIATTFSIPLHDAERYASLLAAGTAFAFERERLAQEGVALVSALDDTFPPQLRHQLHDACPSFLLVAGPLPSLGLSAMGVVGSRDAPAEALQAATTTAPVAAAHSMAVVSGLARGIDQAAMAAALDAGVPVVGVPCEGVRVAARNPEIRRRTHNGELCIASPYAPSARFTAGNALGRNKIVYAHAAATLVVCAAAGSGGTWAGASEAIRRGFGRVAVWTGTGAGPGNAALVELGGFAIDEVDRLPELGAATPPSSARVQPSLFD